MRLTLHNGETLTIEDFDVPRVYENLRRLAPKPGAVTMAGVLAALTRERPGLRSPLDLTEPQSAILLEAIAMPALE